MTSTFWLLRHPRTQRLAEEMPAEYETTICPAYEGHRRGGKRLSGLSVIVHPLGVRDFTWSWTSEILVSQRVLDLFEEHRVTGFEALRAKTAYPKTIKARPPDLFELVVTGWGGWAASAAGVSLLESCPGCGHKVYAIAQPSRLIDPAAWDGSDLFIVWPLPNFRFVSDRLASILRQERVSGVELVPAPQIPLERGVDVTPGLLTECMPENRARELGRHFGIS